MKNYRAVLFLLTTFLVLPGSTAIFPLLFAAGAALTGAGLAIPALGFGAGGVVAGSVAACIQSVVYGGAATGVFAICQSLGATGAWAMYAGAGAVISLLSGAAAFCGIF